MNESEALKVIIEYIFDLTAQSNVYGEPLDTIYKVAGMACGKLASTDGTDWENVHEVAQKVLRGDFRKGT